MGRRPNHGVPMNTIIRLKKPKDKPKYPCRLCGKDHHNENYGFCSNACRKEHPSFLVTYEFSELQLAREFVQKRRKPGMRFIKGDNNLIWVVTGENAEKLITQGYIEII
jgi:hypothetical protein